VGLLEKAGKIKDDEKPKKAAKAKKADPKPVKTAKSKTPAKEKAKREPRKKTPREPRVMPDEFQLAGRAARGARALVDFIVSYAGIVGLIAFTATGAFFNPTLFLIGAFLPLLLNMIILPMKTNRTVGMFMTRSRYVNSKGNHPHWTHLFLSNLTGLLIMIGLSALLMGTANLTDPSTKKEGQTALVFAAIVLLIPMTDYVVTKLRKANGQNQNMYDAVYGCWYVVAERAETGENRWMSRLESLGDWGEKKGWSGSAADDEEAESDD
jgi:uncharacterized RDD family membrane protein YckC